MKRERRQPTRAEWAVITTSRPLVVLRYPKPPVEDQSSRLENMHCLGPKGRLPQ
jgi:hypothetical protein